jgi:hypothetical protein
MGGILDRLLLDGDGCLVLLALFVCLSPVVSGLFVSLFLFCLVFASFAFSYLFTSFSYPFLTFLFVVFVFLFFPTFSAGFGIEVLADRARNWMA